MKLNVKKNKLLKKIEEGLLSYAGVAVDDEHIAWGGPTFPVSLSRIAEIS